MHLTAPAEVLEDPEKTEKHFCSFSYSLLVPPYKKPKKYAGERFYNMG
jgi:hypothetical protein